MQRVKTVIPNTISPMKAKNPTRGMKNSELTVITDRNPQLRQNIARIAAKKRKRTINSVRPAAENCRKIK